MVFFYLRICPGINFGIHPLLRVTPSALQGTLHERLSELLRRKQFANKIAGSQKLSVNEYDELAETRANISRNYVQIASNLTLYSTKLTQYVFKCSLVVSLHVHFFSIMNPRH